MEGRRGKFEGIFRTLGDAGIDRDDLYLAWDFTVASEADLSGRVLAIRDDAFAKLGDTDLTDLTVQGDAPTFQQNVDVPDTVADVLGDVDIDPVPNPVDFGTIDGRRDFPPCSACTSSACEEGESDTTARRVTGQLAVPCYLNLPGCPPGAGFVNGEPSQTPTTSLANAICTIPREAVDSGGHAAPARPPSTGTACWAARGEVGARQRPGDGPRAQLRVLRHQLGGHLDDGHRRTSGLLLRTCRHSNTLAGPHPAGLRELQVPRALADPSRRLHRRTPRSGPSGQSVIDDDALFYDGNSQGGILGGASPRSRPTSRAPCSACRA